MDVMLKLKLHCCYESYSCAVLHTIKLEILSWGKYLADVTICWILIDPAKYRYIFGWGRRIMKLLGVVISLLISTLR